ncbi:MAG: sensor histidine kinase [Burkholderiaceae bacterium]
MSLSMLHRMSLRQTLLLALFPGLMLVGGAQLWLAWRSAVDAANSAYDRSLLGAIKSMDANISTASGGLGVELPYIMLEFFQLTASGQVFYRVATEDGLIEIGSPDLPAPANTLITGKPQFTDGVYFGEPVRIGSYARLLDRPLSGQAKAQRVIIQVAETLESRQEFTRALVLQALARDLTLVLTATLLLVMAVGWALRPLTSLRNAVVARKPEDMTAISAPDIPADVQPLVDAINFHIERNRRLVEARRRFVDDASHQLRTPLATLATQVGYAVREPDPNKLRHALVAIRQQLDETVRQTNQMLSLARAESAEVTIERMDAGALALEVTQKWWSEFREHGVDLGIEQSEQALTVLGQPGLLKEALSNLIHNALRYTPRGGQVTVQVSRQESTAEITVLDNGPGIPQAELIRAGERFFRGSNMNKPGTGLGLAIVQSITERLGGSLRLRPGEDGVGLAATIAIPLAAPASPASRT